VRRAALCVLLAVALAGCGGARHVGGPLPRRFVPVSLSALDDRTFLLLGSVPCPAGRCYAIERTADGGRSFLRLQAPQGMPTEGTNPTMRFADRRNGFVWVPFGRGEFWGTHDGGATWRQLTSPEVAAFTTAAGRIYAVIARCTPTHCSRYRFARGSTSATRWTESRLPFTPDGPVLDLAAHGRNVWLLGTPGGMKYQRHDLLARSSDGGRTFTTSPGPCVPGLGGDREPSSAHALWAVCPTGMMAGAARSTDGGLSFAPLHTPQLVNSARLAPASDDTAVLAGNGTGRPLRSADGGATWRAVEWPRRASCWSTNVVFTDARIGEALQLCPRSATVWRTSDGGATWSKIQQG
jgi:hypothetical protein